MNNEPKLAQHEARQFPLSPYSTPLPCVVDLSLVAFEEWAVRWEFACAALQAIGLKWNDEELEKAFSKRKDERSAP